MRADVVLRLVLRFSLGLCAAALPAAVVSGRAADLTVPAGLPSEQPVPDAHPYDTGQDADAAVAAAISRARSEHKLVLIDLGANWCPDCRMLSGVLAMPQVKPWVDDRFEIVKVDVDRFNRNLDVPGRYGVKVKQIPTVLVVTPEGKLLNGDGTLTLGNARRMTPQSDVDLIASWAARAS